MEGKLQQVLGEDSEWCRNILRKFLCRARAISSMTEGVVWGMASILLGKSLEDIGKEIRKVDMRSV